jgi:hypothetical protein
LWIGKSGGNLLADAVGPVNPAVMEIIVADAAGS